jgi:hypothetical protein
LTEEDQVIVLRNVNEELESVELSDQKRWEEPPHRSLHRPNVRNVLILAYNGNIGLIIAELTQHAASDIKVVVACANAEAAESQVRARYSEVLTERLTLDFVEFDLAEAWRLETFDVMSFDVVFIVADETDLTVDADSKTIMLLLLLGEIKNNSNEDDFPPVVAELLNAESKLLCEGTPLTDAIVSTEILSIQLAQLVRDPFLDTLYKELLNAGGIEIGLRPIANYVDLSQSVTMNEITKSALRFNEVILGFRRQGDDVVINPAKDQALTFSESDLLIVLAQQIYA